MRSIRSKNSLSARIQNIEPSNLPLAVGEATPCCRFGFGFLRLFKGLDFALSLSTMALANQMISPVSWSMRSVTPSSFCADDLYLLMSGPVSEGWNKPRGVGSTAGAFFRLSKTYRVICLQMTSPERGRGFGLSNRRAMQEHGQRGAVDC